jgi:ketosteroid isomerase-like protein
MPVSRTPEFVSTFTSAVDSHSPDAVVACFTDDCEFLLPQHPARSFVGRIQALHNWTTIFSAVPDLRVKALDVAHEGDRCWVEWEYTGTRTDGQAHHMRGVTIVDVDETARLRSARFYVDYVDTASASIGEHLGSMTKSAG